MEHTRIEYQDYPADNVTRHKAICDELNDLYKRKNADYGDSFHETYKEYGVAMPLIRLSDKLNRLKRLTKTKGYVEQSIRDTAIDLANYAIMFVMEMDGDQNVD